MNKTPTRGAAARAKRIQIWTWALVTVVSARRACLANSAAQRSGGSKCAEPVIGRSLDPALEHRSLQTWLEKSHACSIEPLSCRHVV